MSRLVDKPSNVIVLCCALLGISLVAWAETEPQRPGQVAPYSQVHATIPVAITYIQGDHYQAFLTKARANQSTQVSTEVVDGVLYIDAGSSKQNDVVVIQLQAPTLEEVYLAAPSTLTSAGIRGASFVLESHSGGSINLQNIEVDDLSVHLQGPSRMQIQGTAQHQTVSVDGVASYSAQNLVSETSQVTVRGSGQINLWVEKLLDVDIFGSAKVNYQGSPWVSQRIKGSGNLFHL